MREAFLVPSPAAVTTTALPPANPATPARSRATPAGRGPPARSDSPTGSGAPTGHARWSPLPSASATTAIPPADPAACARCRPPPARASSPAGPPTGSRLRSPPLHLSCEIRRFAGQTQIRWDRHRFSSLNEASPDGADRCGANGILSKCQESPAGRSLHRLLLLITQSSARIEPHRATTPDHAKSGRRQAGIQGSRR